MGLTWPLIDPPVLVLKELEKRRNPTADTPLINISFYRRPPKSHN